MLRQLELNTVYDSAECNLVRDLITPLLSESNEYWRGVGFFTSGWLKTACEGIIKLVENGGKAHIVTSPLMQKADWEALQAGDRAIRDKALQEILRKQMVSLSWGLTKNTLNALAWMVADGLLEFRFAIPRVFGTGGEYHDKVGIFIDKAGDMVAIHGSFNDSEKGSLNGEAFSVFKSWDVGQRPYVEQHRGRLLNLWHNGNMQFSIIPLLDAIRQEIVRYRNSERPYLIEHEKLEKKQLDSDPFHQSEIKLRPYQQEAIDAWKQMGFRGIFEMATGTGKTFTALAATAEIRKLLNRTAVLILVPYLHLLEQWRVNCEKFGFSPILCSSTHTKWPNEVRSKIQDFRLGTLPSVCIIAVHQTAATKRFKKVVQGLPPDNTLLIADEVHGLGASRMRDALLPLAEMRLGLSATPRRWYDDEGTQFILDYFNCICFEYTLEKAIGTFLTSYRYIPVPTQLTSKESNEYEKLTNRINVLSTRDLDRNDEDRELLKKLLLQRSKIISAADNKLPLLIEVLKDQIEENQKAGEELRDVLIYCAPGKHKEVLAAVSELGLRCHEFVHTVSMNKRESVLCQFAEGDIQVLVAIHCLDEGVDIPSTKTAFFLASTTNPKEFIQRRGRILRKSEGKVRADVYDFIVVPDKRYADFRRDADLSLLRREMPRFSEFAENAENEFEARTAVWEILNTYQMLHLFDIRPWDIYHQVMELIEVQDRS